MHVCDNSWINVFMTHVFHIDISIYRLKANRLDSGTYMNTYIYNNYRNYVKIRNENKCRFLFFT